MKVLILTWKSFGTEDIVDAFHQNNIEVVKHPFSDNTDNDFAEAKNNLTNVIKSVTPDFLFTFNYFPVVSIVCKDLDIPYVSWIYDSPYVRLYHYSINYPRNIVFVFDKSQFLEFHNAGINTVHYLPMAANTDRLNSMQNFKTFRQTGWYNQHEVAFIGSLYTEKHQFFQRMNSITPYTHGYLDGLMAAQKQIYGYNFIQQLLPADIISDMRKSLPMSPGIDSVESIEYLFAQYVINRQITANERQELLTAVAERFSLDLYTPDKKFFIKNCTNHGPVDYYDWAPYVIKQAKINLNISLRSILSGIPLRAFDIMGSGGFLLTNFQSDFLDFFIPGEDFVYYDSKTDLLDKIDYYLQHDEERAEIAKNGLQKISASHTYKHRIAEILSYL